MSTKPAIVLVHGAWHSPQAYIKFTTALQERGFDVHAPQLPSCTGPRAAGTSSIRDALVVRQLVEQLADGGRTIIVIMHSYGGVVGCNAVENLDVQSRTARGKTGGVAHLIAIAAMIYPKGYNVVDIAHEMNDEKILTTMEIAEDGSSFLKDPRATCYNDTSDEEVEVVLKTLARCDVQSMEERVHFEAWRVLPLTYILAIKDAALPRYHQQCVLDKLEAAGHKADVRTFDSDHSPFLSKLRETVQVVEDVAGKLSSRS
jgi:pimeloyl-ACP methyl ester carboxylesterase